jgi:hypothetical protein
VNNLFAARSQTAILHFVPLTLLGFVPLEAVLIAIVYLILGVITAWPLAKHEIASSETRLHEMEDTV